MSLSFSLARKRVVEGSEAIMKNPADVVSFAFRRIAFA